jgi:hypothetical protein
MPTHGANLGNQVTFVKANSNDDSTIKSGIRFLKTLKRVFESRSISSTRESLWRWSRMREPSNLNCMPGVLFLRCALTFPELVQDAASVAVQRLRHLHRDRFQTPLDSNPLGNTVVWTDRSLCCEQVARRGPQLTALKVIDRGGREFQVSSTFLIRSALLAAGAMGMMSCVAASPPARSPPVSPKLAPATAPVRITQSSMYGRDELVGVLNVTASAAYYQMGNTRISLVQAPPMTATGASELKAQTAQELGSFAGKRVRAQGDLQGTLLWEAQVTLAD